MTDAHPLDIPPFLKREKSRAAAKKAPPAKGKKAKAPPAKKAKTKPVPPRREVPDNVVTLKELCNELGMQPVLARVRLRAAVEAGTIKHAPSAPWEWERGSDELATVRKVLSD